MVFCQTSELISTLDFWKGISLLQFVDNKLLKLKKEICSYLEISDSFLIVGTSSGLKPLSYKQISAVGQSKLQNTSVRSVCQVNSAQFLNESTK